jgi:ubiquitin carboxyl-terminal hydrolase 22/27/51
MQFLLDQLHNANADEDRDKGKQCSCIIHKSFYGILQSDVTCRKCKNVTTTHDPVMDLSLDLSLDLRIPEKKKKLHSGDSTAQSHPPTLTECLEGFTNPEKLGANDYNCQKCEGSQAATKQLTLERLPPVLCVQFKACIDLIRT